MLINLKTIVGLDPVAHSLIKYQAAFDIGYDANHSSENPFNDKNLSLAFTNGYEVQIVEDLEDDYHDEDLEYNYLENDYT